jgi:hypothetical protein
MSNLGLEGNDELENAFYELLNDREENKKNLITILDFYDSIIDQLLDVEFKGDVFAFFFYFIYCSILTTKNSFEIKDLWIIILLPLIKIIFYIYQKLK